MSGHARIWGARIAVALGSWLAAGLTAELVVRSFGVSVGGVQINRRTVEPDPDPKLRFRLRPGSVAHAEVEYRINSLGLRGPETRAVKPADVTRVVVIGDSIAFGYWVAEQDAFPRQLERLANAHRRSERAVEVLNLGVPGYNLSQSFAALRRRGIDLGPDLVVVSVCLNDFETIFSVEYGITEDLGELRDSDRWWVRMRSVLLDRSMLAAWFEYLYAHVETRRGWAVGGSRTEAGVGAARAPPDGRAARETRERDVSSRGFRALAKLLARSGGVPSLVVLFPAFDSDYPAYSHLGFHELVREGATDAGLPFLDLLDCFSAYPPRDLGVDPLHPSPLGHRVAAHAILDRIASRALLPGAAFDLSAAGDCRGYRVEEFPTVRGY